jgi:hypothetical protein
MQPFLLAVKRTYMTSVRMSLVPSCILHSEGNTVIFKQTTCGSFYVLMSDVYDSDMSVNKLTGL